MSLTTDRNDPNLHKVKDNGQNEAYIILSDEERAKGFVRPVRQSYVHVGTDWNQIEHELRPSSDGKYAGVLYHVKRDGEFIGGRFLTFKEFEDYSRNKHTGGCGAKTTMALAIAETYARDPKFYGATFCCGCGKHLPVAEFIWDDGTGQTVGS